jgi:hypothetical protein
MDDEARKYFLFIVHRLDFILLSLGVEAADLKSSFRFCVLLLIMVLVHRAVNTTRVQLPPGSLFKRSVYVQQAMSFVGSNLRSLSATVGKRAFS